MSEDVAIGARGRQKNTGKQRLVRLLYGREGLELRLPPGTLVLAGRDAPALADPDAAVARALASPIGAPPLLELVRLRRPRRVAVTVSDLTRPVPNPLLLRSLLRVLGEGGVPPERVVVLIGTGMHRPSTPEERRILLGEALGPGVEVIDHCAAAPDTLVQVSREPPVFLNRRFVEADLRIVTGLIEPHFMAGFSGGRKGVCPALADLRTVQDFHSYRTLSDQRAESGVLDGNPCHDLALRAARTAGVDLLLNVALTRGREVCGVYCGELEAAHLAGCAEVGALASAAVDGPCDLVVSCGGGFPLDQTFYQTVKGMVAALPALAPRSTLLVVSGCGEGVGSPAYTALMRRWGGDFRGFLAHLAARPGHTELDQWELQMQCRVLERIGPERLWFASDGLPEAVQSGLGVTPLPGPGDARARAQAAVDRFIAAQPEARVAVMPDGPYTLLES